jgi:hypothetical protein
MQPTEGPDESNNLPVIVRKNTVVYFEAGNKFKSILSRKEIVSPVWIRNVHRKMTDRGGLALVDVRVSPSKQISKKNKTPWL